MLRMCKSCAIDQSAHGTALLPRAVPCTAAQVGQLHCYCGWCALWCMTALCVQCNTHQCFLCLCNSMSSSLRMTHSAVLHGAQVTGQSVAVVLAFQQSICCNLLLIYEMATTNRQTTKTAMGLVEMLLYPGHKTICVGGGCQGWSW